MARCAANRLRRGQAPDPEEASHPLGREPAFHAFEKTLIRRVARKAEG
jgi:hypothetical protein